MDKNKPYNDLPLLPPSMDLEMPSLLKKAISANRTMAELKGAVKSIPNQRILVDGIVLQEAKLSSEIENILTTNDELYRAAADEEHSKDPQAKEVLRYREALWQGIKILKKRPLATNVFVEIVEIIKGKNIGIRRFPVTKIANGKGEVIYTPPEGETVIREKLSNLEKFIHAEDDIDPLIKLAVLHYQFEAIHPFADGNGRTGRIINILFLMEKGLLNSPILFLSHYILKTKSSYYSGLREVTEKGNWKNWISYILDAIEITSAETHKKVNKILVAIEDAQQLVKSKAPKIYSKDLIEVIFHHPYCKIKFIERAGLAKRQTAAVYLQTLEKIGLLESIKIGREQYYINKKLIKILSK